VISNTAENVVMDEGETVHAEEMEKIDLDDSEMDDSQDSPMHVISKGDVPAGTVQDSTKSDVTAGIIMVEDSPAISKGAAGTVQDDILIEDSPVPVISKGAVAAGTVQDNTKGDVTADTVQDNTKNYHKICFSSTTLQSTTFTGCKIPIVSTMDILF
jgi:hypothetical protein